MITIALWVLLPAMVVVALVGALGGYFFKRASKNISLHPIKLLKNWAFWVAAIFYVISTLAYVTLLKYAPLSIMYPLSSLQYVWVALLSWWLLKEKLNTGRIAGIGIIILGIVVLTLGA